jgi:hypothetical protein
MLDLRGLAPDLLWVYRTGPSDALRLLALSGLLHLRTESSLDDLVQLSVQMSARVQEATYRGLAAVFLDQYPVLHEVAARSHTLSMADIRRARARSTAAPSTSDAAAPAN